MATETEKAPPKEIEVDEETAKDIDDLLESSADEEEEEEEEEARVSEKLENAKLEGRKAAEDGEPEPPAGDEDEEPAEPAEPAKGRPKRSGTVLVAPQKKGGNMKIGPYIHADVPSSLKRKDQVCCRKCRLIKTVGQFVEVGCEVCPELDMRGHEDSVDEYTSKLWDGIMAVVDPKDSWARKWVRLGKTIVPGCYAMRCGDLWID